MDKDLLVEALREVLNEHRKIDDDRHATHHQFIEMEIKRRERRHEMWKRFKLSFVGGLALAALGVLGWLGKIILQHFHIQP